MGAQAGSESPQMQNDAPDSSCKQCSDSGSSMQRRSAIGIILGTSGALAAGAFGLVAGFLSSAIGRTIAHPWIRIGPAEDLDAETFKRHLLRVDHDHAWIHQRKSMVVYIKDLYPKDPVVLLSKCSHLGCSVKWDEEGKKFRCPCHGGVYDEHGNVESGPPPRPLTQLEVKIESDICFVRLPGDQQSSTQDAST